MQLQAAAGCWGGLWALRLLVLQRPLHAAAGQASCAPSAAEVLTTGSLITTFDDLFGGVAFDPEGNMIVTDGDNHRVHVRTIGSHGSGNGQFSSPHGGIAVADTLNHRAQDVV